MLDDLAVVIETEYVHAGPIRIAGPFLAGVKNDMVSFRKNPDKMNAFSRVLTIHTLKVFDERLFSVADHGIVLDIF